VTPAAHDGSVLSSEHDVAERRCDWCGELLLPGTRRDAVTCSKSCRQARHRWNKGVGSPPPGLTDRPMHLAYADPPYPGLSSRYYRNHHDYAGEVDHAELIARLVTYDGWALSTSAAALPRVLRLCPPEVKVGSWHRGARPNDSERVQNGWEPVIYSPAREVVAIDGEGPATLRRVDTLVRGVTARTTDPNRVIGAKPSDFCGWVFRMMGALPGDSFDDLFPGSGGVERAWRAYSTAAR